MELLIFVILVILNGFFSISEISIVSSKKSRLEELKNSGKKGAAAALKLQNEPDIFLSAVLVGMTLVSLIIGAFGGMTFASSVAPYVQRIHILQPYAQEIALVLTMVVITYITIVAGELFPKTVALSNPERVASVIAQPITFFSKFFYPFVKLLSVSNRFISRTLGIKKRSDTYTEYELRHILRSAVDEGVIEDDLTDMHENVFHFSDKRAKHLMTNRMEVEWIDMNKTEKELKAELNSVQHTKVVCARETLDNLVGIIHVPDFYKISLSGKRFKVKDLVKLPVVVHENTTASNVLKQLRENSSHFCVVVDEFGDFEGVITIHDIMENVIGDVPEEGEFETPHYITNLDGSVLINGDAPIETLTQVIDVFNVDFEQIDYVSVAGFVIDQISEIPKEGDELNYRNYLLEVIEMDGNRIDKILIIKQEEEPKGDEE